MANRQQIYKNESKIIACGMENYNNFQYIYTDLSQDTVLVSQVYFFPSDYFVGNDKVIVLNSKDFIIITLSTNSSVDISPEFTLTFTNNIFYETSSSSYLALY